MNPRYTAIILVLILYGVPLGYAQYSSIGSIDAADRLEITEKTKVIKNLNVTDALEISEKTGLISTISQISK